MANGYSVDCARHGRAGASADQAPLEDMVDECGRDGSGGEEADEAGRHRAPASQDSPSRSNASLAASSPAATSRDWLLETAHDDRTSHRSWPVRRARRRRRVADRLGVASESVLPNSVAHRRGARRDGQAPYTWRAPPGHEHDLLRAAVAGFAVGGRCFGLSPAGLRQTYTFARRPGAGIRLGRAGLVVQLTSRTGRDPIGAPRHDIDAEAATTGERAMRDTRRASSSYTLDGHDRGARSRRQGRVLQEPDAGAVPRAQRPLSDGRCPQAGHDWPIADDPDGTVTSGRRRRPLARLRAVIEPRLASRRSRRAVRAGPRTPRRSPRPALERREAPREGSVDGSERSPSALPRARSRRRVTSGEARRPRFAVPRPPNANRPSARPARGTAATAAPRGPPPAGRAPRAPGRASRPRPASGSAA